MVESLGKSRDELYESLLIKVREQFEKASELPIVIEKEEGGVQITAR